MSREEGSPAIEDFSAFFEPGSLAGIIGRNGAGKTSLALVLAGLVPRIVPGQWTGKVTFRDSGLTPKGWPAGVIAAYCSQDFSSSILLGSLRDALSVLPPDLVGLARSLPFPAPETSVKHLSTGQSHLLFWLLGLARQPGIFIMDEGLSSLDRDAIDKLVPRCKEIAASSEACFLILDQDEFRLSGLTQKLLILTGPSRRHEQEGLPAGDVSDILKGVAEERFRAMEKYNYVGSLCATWSKEHVFCTEKLELAPGICVVLRGSIGTGKSTILKAVGGFPGPKGLDESARLAKKHRPMYLGVEIDFVLMKESIRLVLGQAAPAALNLDSLWERVHGFFKWRNLDVDPGILSFGQRRLLALMTVFLGSEGFLALDEPDKGLDRRAQELIALMISAFCSSGGIILLATHNERFVELLQSRMEGGKILHVEMAE